jgi:uncharacterized protein YdeI (YjbR/CyaY-like superfamily)
MKPKFFKTPADFRKWLHAYHDKEPEVLVGFYKRDSGKPSITWPESVDQALCYGWIDGIRKRVDEISYTIRFTPRRTGSNWSTVNVKRAQELVTEGSMHAAGLKAFEARREDKAGVYAYENRSENLPEPYEKVLKKNKAAWEFFKTQAPYYRKVMFWWIVSAKKEETRLKRLEQLVEKCARGERLGP